MKRKRSPSDSRNPSRSHSPAKSYSERSDPDEEGSVHVKKGDLIRNERYSVIRKAGKGTFGTVLEVYDKKHKENIALKVIRSVKRYLDSAYIEVNILEKIRKSDRQQESKIVRLLGAFTTRIKGQKHVCIAFEKLGISVYDFIKRNKYRGFMLNHVSRIGYDLVHSVAYCHSVNLTHTDLKPENILFVNDSYETSSDNKRGDKYRMPKQLDVRLIDFGSATFEEDYHSQIINTRQYRAPEVILQLGWNEKSDIWSIGCILAELHTGELLFATHENGDHLAQMEKILRKPLPVWMIKHVVKHARRSTSRRRSRSRRKRRKNASPSEEPLHVLFNRDTMKLRIYEDRRSKERLDYVKTLEELIPDDDLRDCIRKCLVYDPEERISAEALRKHPFFRDARLLEEEKREKHSRRS